MGWIFSHRWSDAWHNRKVATFLDSFEKRMKGPERGQSRSQSWKEIGEKMGGGDGTLLTKRHAKRFSHSEAFEELRGFSPVDRANTTAPQPLRGLERAREGVKTTLVPEYHNYYRRYAIKGPPVETLGKLRVSTLYSLIRVLSSVGGNKLTHVTFQARNKSDKNLVFVQKLSI